MDLLPELIKLNVNGCVSLTRLLLPSCTKLEWLDCSGCALMHHIHTFSTALSHVKAVACHRLVVSCCCYYDWVYGSAASGHQNSVQVLFVGSVLMLCVSEWR